MREMIFGISLSFPWWSYCLALAVGLAFGYIQIWLLRRAVHDGGGRKRFIALALLLWALAITGIALLHVRLLIMFAMAAALVLLCGVWLSYQKRRRKRDQADGEARRGNGM